MDVVRGNFEINGMTKYDDGFNDKKPTNLGRCKVTCGMTVDPCIVDKF